MKPGRPAPNAKFRIPKIALTKRMTDAGLNALSQMVNGAEEHTDEGLVAAVFYEMWTAYWSEIEEVGRKKAAGSPLVRPPSLILPP